ncbi:uncharacterized protein [Drosophila tropicalis]|uniref:uncharacterized protein n=1 Tax=Drosophila tropicalis TaxID=46794 RepID=UPI0035AB9432
MSKGLQKPLVNHIFLTSNGEYVTNVLKLCERITLQQKRVLLITHRQSSFVSNLEGNPFGMLALDMTVCSVDDVESAPGTIIRLFDQMVLPDIIIFDMHSIIWSMLQRPVMQQCSTDKLVRNIAKCSAAFTNYLGMVREVDTLVIMPQDSYPLTPAQFQLLIDLYFYDNECSTNFSQISTSIGVAQGFK